MTKIAVALAFVGLNFYVYGYLATDEVIPARETFASLPNEIAEWRCSERTEMAARARRILGVTDYLLCDFVSATDGEGVGVYVGYHESQVRRGGAGASVIHPPEHCLPGAGWAIVDARRTGIDFSGLPAGRGLRDDERLAKRFVIAKGDQRQLVYFWYQGQGRVVSANEDVILWRFWNRAVRGRTDGALVRFTTRIDRNDLAAAEGRIERFASVFVPLLPPTVPE